jgi:hypothetical protein
MGRSEWSGFLSPDGGIGYTLQKRILAWGEARARNNIRRICDERATTHAKEPLAEGAVLSHRLVSNSYPLPH